MNKANHRDHIPYEGLLSFSSLLMGEMPSIAELTQVDTERFYLSGLCFAYLCCLFTSVFVFIYFGTFCDYFLLGCFLYFIFNTIDHTDHIPIIQGIQVLFRYPSKQIDKLKSRVVYPPFQPFFKRYSHIKDLI